MVKFAGTNNESGSPVLGIGLSRENLNRMLEGNPINFTTVSMAGLPSVEVLLFAGETDDEMAATMMGGGAVTPEQVHEDKSLADPHIRPADATICNVCHGEGTVGQADEGTLSLCPRCTSAQGNIRPADKGVN